MKMRKKKEKEARTVRRLPSPSPSPPLLRIRDVQSVCHPQNWNPSPPAATVSQSENCFDGRGPQKNFLRIRQDLTITTTVSETDSDSYNRCHSRDPVAANISPQPAKTRGDNNIVDLVADEDYCEILASSSSPAPPVCSPAVNTQPPVTTVTVSSALSGGGAAGGPVTPGQNKAAVVTTLRDDTRDPRLIRMQRRMEQWDLKKPTIPTSPINLALDLAPSAGQSTSGATTTAAGELARPPTALPQPVAAQAPPPPVLENLTSRSSLKRQKAELPPANQERHGIPAFSPAWTTLGPPTMTPPLWRAGRPGEGGPAPPPSPHYQPYGGAPGPVWPPPGRVNGEFGPPTPGLFNPLPLQHDLPGTAAEKSYVESCQAIEISQLKSKLDQANEKINSLIRLQSENNFEIFKSISTIDSLNLSVFRTLEECKNKGTVVQNSVSQHWLKHCLLAELQSVRAALPNIVLLPDETTRPSDDLNSTSLHLQLRHSLLRKIAELLNCSIEIRSIKLPSQTEYRNKKL